MFNLNFNSNIILEIQNYLINIKNIYPTLPTIYPTGIYDDETRNAVATFQNIKGLPPTGTVDIQTWNALIHGNNEYKSKTQSPSRIPVSTPGFADVKKGDQRDIVYAIKIMLNHFQRRYINYNELEISNLYDERTEEAVAFFQQRSMLPVTGIVDKNTWNTLVAIYDTCRFYR